MKKRLLNLFLTICLALGLLPVSAGAAGTVTATGRCGEDITWTLDSQGTLTLEGTGPMTNYTYQGSQGVTTPWYAARTQIRQVTLGEGITTVGDWAFANCYAMTDLTLPEGVTRIGGGAFHGCRAMTEVDIPETVTFLGWYAFQGCIGLEEVVLPPGLTSIQNQTFSVCNQLERVNIPAGVTVIGYGAFECTDLTEITLPEGVTTIESCAFGTTDLEEITLPASLENIEDFAFDRCLALTDVRYLGDQEAWARVDLEEAGNEALLAATLWFGPEQEAPELPKFWVALLQFLQGLAG